MQRFMAKWSKVVTFTSSAWSDRPFLHVYSDPKCCCRFWHQLVSPNELLITHTCHIASSSRLQLHPTQPERTDLLAPLPFPLPHVIVAQYVAVIDKVMVEQQIFPVTPRTSRQQASFVI